MATEFSTGFPKTWCRGVNHCFFGGKYLEYSRHALKIGVGLGRKVLGLFLKGWGGTADKAGGGGGRTLLKTPVGPDPDTAQNLRKVEFLLVLFTFDLNFMAHVFFT